MMALVSNINEQIQEYDDIIQHNNNNFTQTLHNKTITCQLQHTKIRTLYWLILLDILQSDRTDIWLQQVNKQYELYQQYHKQYLQHDITNDNDDIDPLTAINNNNVQHSNNNNNTWSTYFNDNELMNSINKDIQRTYSDIIFFQQYNIQNIMKNILFIYCKFNNNISYKQGMNEIIAIITYVVYNDCITRTNNNNNSNQQHILYTLFDIQYIESYIFAMFTVIMNRLLSLYSHNNNINTTHNTSDNKTLTQRCEYIMTNILQRIDYELYQHITVNNNIDIQIFALRQYRLLFTREFNNINDILLLWDFILSQQQDKSTNNDKLDIIDYLVVSRILLQRNQLLQCNDNNEILSVLMQTNNTNITPYDMIQKAINIQPQLQQPLYNIALPVNNSVITTYSNTTNANIQNNNNSISILTSQLSNNTKNTYQSSYTTSSIQQQFKTLFSEITLPKQLSSLFNNNNSKQLHNSNINNDNNDIPLADI